MRSVKIYVRVYSELITLENKMLFIALYLKEDAFKWFKLIIKDFVKNKKKDKKLEIRRMFTNVINFEKVIK